MAPRIGLPVTVADPEAKYASYAAAVHAAGGVVVFLPPESAEHVDGLLLLGGGDVEPARYHAAAHPRSEAPDLARDAWELALIGRALAAGTPLLGICRGLQILNVALGGTLVQHLPDHGAEHQLEDGGQHPVTIAPGTRLASILGVDRLSVNSRHHQAVDRPGYGIVVTARGSDGVIEGFELPGPAFTVAVQWHPEGLSHTRPDQQALFAALVEAAALYAAAPQG